jgi:hypothetical protein
MRGFIGEITGVRQEERQCIKSEDPEQVRKMKKG